MQLDPMVLAHLRMEVEEVRLRGRAVHDEIDDTRECSGGQALPAQAIIASFAIFVVNSEDSTGCASSVTLNGGRNKKPTKFGFLT